MSEELVIQLLQEIPDLQKLHVDTHTNALENQEESIDIQMRALCRQKITLFILGIFLLILLAFLVWPWNFMGGPSFIRTTFEHSSPPQQYLRGHAKPHALPQVRREFGTVDFPWTAQDMRPVSGTLVLEPSTTSRAEATKDQMLNADFDEYGRLRKRVGKPPTNDPDEVWWF